MNIMNKEIKDLLLTEIGARLPYDLIVQIEVAHDVFVDSKVTSLTWDEGCNNWRVNDYLIENVKLYLIPFSEYFEKVGKEELNYFCGELDFNQQRQYCNRNHIDCGGLFLFNVAINKN